MCLAVPARVVETLDPSRQLARVEIAGVTRTVSLGLLDGTPPPGPGEWVLIHVGFAIARVDEEEALATHRLLAQMGAEYERELEELRGSAIE
jgi:hydrogenase expression/formation protein HypC